MELEDTMASLNISDNLFNSGDPVLNNSVASDSEEETSPTESIQLRRSVRLNSSSCSEKRRVLIKPSKTPKNNFKETENYYLDKRTKRLNSPLETIYEESRQQRSGESFMSSKKLRRIINFSAAKSVKIKKRKMKAKQLSASQRINNRQKIPIAYLIEKLSEIRDE